MKRRRQLKRLYKILRTAPLGEFVNFERWGLMQKISLKFLGII